MPIFRKKPVTVEAHRLQGDLDVFNEMDDVKLTFHGLDELAYATVQTEEGPLRAQPGDWIITGVEGERYPCKDSIFRATYEEATPPSVNIRAMRAAHEVEDLAAHFQKEMPRTAKVLRAAADSIKLAGEVAVWEDEKTQHDAGEAQG